MVTKEQIMDWEVGSHANTFGGSPVACAAALQVIEIIRRGKLPENAVMQGAYLTKRLNELQSEYPIIEDVRGRGLMIVAEIVKDPRQRNLQSRW